MAEVSGVVLDRMADAYSQALGRLQDAAERVAVDAWFSHNSFQSEDDEEWNDTFWMILSSVAFAIEGLTSAYYQAQRDYLGIAPRIALPDTLDALRNEFDGWGDSPPTRARYLVSDSQVTGTEAIRGAATRVSKLTAGATRMVEQTALDDLFDQIEDQLIYEFDTDRPDQIFSPTDNDEVAALHEELSGQYRMAKKGKGALMYKRVTTSAKPCGWCQAQSGRLLTAETRRKDRKWHTNCRCTWREITAAESRAWQPISGEAFKALLPIRSGPEPE